MTKIEALRAELKCREMVEGTSLNWWDVIKLASRHMVNPPNFSRSVEEYEFALGIIEGRPVWEGDTIYIDGAKIIIGAHSVSTLHEWNKAGLVSWNPPTLKTVMVELMVEDAKWMAAAFNSPNPGSPSNIASACRKALENLK